MVDGDAPDHGPLTPDPVFRGHRPPAPGHAPPEEQPPFGASWNTLYGAVAATLAALIVLFGLFTRAFE